MANTAEKEIIFLKENSEWLRYVLWAGAIGLGVVAFQAFNTENRDYGKIIGSTLGVLLMGFSGFVFKTRQIKLDPTQRLITITSKGFRQATIDTVKFDDIRKILVVLTMSYDNELTPNNRWQKGWTLALACASHNVQLTLNPENQLTVLEKAQKIQRLVNVEIAASIDESIIHHLKMGRKIDAIALATHQLGLTTTQAKDFVEDRMKTL